MQTKSKSLEQFVRDHPELNIKVVSFTVCTECAFWECWHGFCSDAPCYPSANNGENVMVSTK